MGKRSTFQRREADFYPTPRAAALPLVPYLHGIRSFAEPCARDGALVWHLESFGLRCVYAGDIRTGQDALTVDDYGAADMIITNPPWSRDQMHRLIRHFQNIAPTWLLLDADWAHTKQAAPFLPHCSDIVAIGRVKWIEGSKHTGKDNCAWYRFNALHKGGPVFHCRTDDIVAPIRRTAICKQCRKAYEPQRSSSQFCSQTCRERAHRDRLSVTSSVTLTPSEFSEVFRYVRHADVPRFIAEGWELLPALDSTHHGEYSALMRRRAEGRLETALGRMPAAREASEGTALPGRKQAGMSINVDPAVAGQQEEEIMGTYLCGYEPTTKRGECLYLNSIAWDWVAAYCEVVAADFFAGRHFPYEWDHTQGPLGFGALTAIALAEVLQAEITSGRTAVFLGEHGFSEDAIKNTVGLYQTFADFARESGGFTI